MSKRSGMDAFDRKHLKAWLQQSVFSDDRRKVGKIIRTYVRRHPEVIGQSRSWPEIQRLAESSGINPRDVGVLQKKREARERAAQIRAAAGRNNPRRVFWDPSINKFAAHKYLSKYGNIVGTGESKAAAVRSLKEAIARAKGGSHNPEYIYFEMNGRKYRTDGAIVEGKDGNTWNRTGSLPVVVKARELWRARSNPAELMVMAANPRVEVVHGDNPPVEEIAEEFSGVDVKYIDVYNEPHIPRGRYAYLAKLYRLLIKPEKGGQVQRITFNQTDPPLIVSDSTGKQIYFVGGAQDLTESVGAFTDGPISAPSRTVLGEGREIHYIGKKHNIDDEDTDEWRHKHGEEDGMLPTVVFDAQNKRLLYEGGNYRIEGPWMHN